MAYTIICQRQAGKNFDLLDYLRNKNPQATIEQNAESGGTTTPNIHSNKTIG